MRDEQGQAAERDGVDGNHDVHDPGPPPRFAGVDPDEAGVGVRAPVDSNMEHAGERDVGDVATTARDEPPVLPPAHAGAE